MEQERMQDAGDEQQEPTKQPWQEPKLAFVEPRLTNHGTVQDITGQESFGDIPPPPP